MDPAGNFVDGKKSKRWSTSEAYAMDHGAPGKPARTFLADDGSTHLLLSDEVEGRPVVGREAWSKKREGTVRIIKELWGDDGR